MLCDVLVAKYFMSLSYSNALWSSRLVLFCFECEIARCGDGGAECFLGIKRWAIIGGKLLNPRVLAVGVWIVPSSIRFTSQLADIRSIFVSGYRNQIIFW
ncbi:MAG: hypothetical protein C5B58_14910 [Acidobacteria bacterium]|nr:MAG: hypothetical protein C5B58_14910 [Acidobacteriota bacterium]